MITISTLLSRFKQAYNDNSDGFVTSPIEYLNRAKDELVDDNAFTFLKKSTSVAYSASDASVDIPSDSKNQGVFALWHTSKAPANKLRQASDDAWYMLDTSATSETPEVFRMFGTTFELHPIPSSDGTMFFEYYRRVPDVSNSDSTIDLPGECEKFLIYKMLEYTFYQEEEQSLGNYYRSLAELELDKLDSLKQSGLTYINRRAYPPLNHYKR